MPQQTVFILDCVTTPISTTSYTLFVPSSPITVSKIQFIYYDPTESGLNVIKLASGLAGSQQDLFVSTGGAYLNTPVNYYLPAGTTLWLEAISSTVSTGYVILTFLNT